MGGEDIPVSPGREGGFYLVLPPGCAGTCSTPRFTFLRLESPADLLWAAECRASPVVHVPGVARYFFSKSLRLERVFAIPAPAGFEVVGPPPTLTRVVRGRYAGGRASFTETWPGSTC